MDVGQGDAALLSDPNGTPQEVSVYDGSVTVRAGTTPTPTPTPSPTPPANCDDIIGYHVIRPGDTLLYHGDSLTVTMHSGHDKALIRYTLDGTLPDSTATLYTRPLILTGNTRLRARVYRKGYRAGPVTKRTYAFIDPARNGLNYTYYPGLWEKVPDFSDLSPAARGVLHQLNLGEIPYNKDRFALRITSRLLIPATGEYTFFLSSNDGSRLWIDGKEVVDNDGPHPARERKGTIFLTKGRHLLTIGYMQVGGGYFLSLGWKGPGIAKETVPPDRFFF